MRPALTLALCTLLSACAVPSPPACVAVQKGYLVSINGHMHLVGDPPTLNCTPLVLEKDPLLINNYTLLPRAYPVEDPRTRGTK